MNLKKKQFALKMKPHKKNFFSFFFNIKQKISDQLTALFYRHKGAFFP